MELLWPWFLLLLILIPLIVLAYIWVVRRRKRFAIRYSSVSLIREAMPGRSSWRRHLPLVLFLIALACLTLALARPVTELNVTSSRATVILALDVSMSMCSSDIEPNRLTAAQEAAKTFISNQESGTQIGIVAFAGFAELVAPPTADMEVLLAAVGDLTTARRTAIGSAILRSLDAIAEINGEVAPVDVFLNPDGSVPSFLSDGESPQPDIIVLLTDGANNSGALPLDAAQAAVDRGIRVYTIGFGTPNASLFQCTPEQLAGVGIASRFGQSRFNRFFAQGFGNRFRRFIDLDEETLQQVSAMTGGEYYLAEGSDELLDVFAEVPAHLVARKVTTEISAIFAALGGLFVLASLGLSQRWNPWP